ncbi:MAG: aminotransferase class I/II-fold pyridoxal phosphate-dependent enzyme [Myxococcota bacterium]|nr:aminotransferase class I/II-fold pyridoxal phosphate-dependent enzyme [Myxococcota bacterium]
MTRPTPEMREAMARAEVGDDLYREDPTTRSLEESVAALLGKEAALFVPSGTMSNQIALLLHTERGCEVIVGEGAHIANNEAGAGAAWSGVQFAVAGRGGLFDGGDVEAAMRPAVEMFPRTALVCVENTHNRAGGRVFPFESILGIADSARRLGLRLHLDGARLWNAAAATGRSEAQWAAPFDTVNVCFSKGLGAPVGSALAGSRAIIERARRFRRMLGGGLRQSGVLAAAAHYALDHHRARLSADHEAARRIATVLAGSPKVISDAGQVETNMVLVELAVARADDVVRRASELGVLANRASPNAVRLVTHLDFPLDAAEPAAHLLLQAIEGAC